jgi:TRAP-type mannitol/chloroaromatic compound transport system substrate-binding protein
MVTTWGATATPIITAANNIARYVEEMSGGEFVIRIVPANKH